MSGGKNGGGDLPDFDNLLQQQAELNRINVVSPQGSATFGPVRRGRGRRRRRRRRRRRGGGSVGFPGIAQGRAGNVGLFAQQPPGGGRGSRRGRRAGRPSTQLTIAQSPRQQRITRLREQGQIGLGQLARGLISDFGTAEDSRQRVEDAIFQRGRRLLEPVFNQQEQNLINARAVRGIPETSQAGDLSNFNRTRDQAFENLALQSIGAGGQESTRLTDQILSALTGVQSQQPAILPPSPVDVTGAGSLFQQQNAANQSAKGNLFGAGLGTAGTLGGAAILAPSLSSRVYKHNGRPVETVLPRIRQLTVEAWDYLPGIDDGGTHIGPYAEEWKELFGVGDGKTIHMVDGLGICLLGIKELIRRTDNG